MGRLLFLSLLLFIFGCKKEVQKSELDKVKGEYEWYHSHDGVFESVNSSDVSDQHGIRIQSKTKVNFYTNSEKVLSLKINRLYQTQDGGTAIVLQWNDHLERAIIIEEGNLTFFDWPISDFHNSFQKVN